MDTLGFSTPCKVRQCSQCQGDTEFYCNTCKHDLCLQCKEKHVIDLDTTYHDVVIYREKYEYIPKQETCVKHPSRIYEKYCQSCELPVCFQCKEHRKHNIFLFFLQWIKDRKHKILDIRTAYKTNRQQHREIIHNIRSETLYNSCFLLAGIKTDIKTCHTEISNCQPEMSTKAQRLKNLIDTVICDVKIRHTRFIQSLQKQKRKMNRHLASIENYEHRSEQSANRAVKFLLFLKKTRVPKIKDSPNLTQHALRSLTEEINMEDVIKLLSEIQILETGKRQVRNECLLKLMSTPVLHRSVTVTGVSEVIQISCVTSDRVWISDRNNLILTNTEGDTLHHLTDVDSDYYTGVHTVNITGDLIYIDRDGNINKLSKDNRTKSSLIKFTKPWSPFCVYCSPSNGDLLVGVYNTDTYTGKVTRYNNTGQHLQTIQHDHTGQTLYSCPWYITENRNGDVIVSDDHTGQTLYSCPWYITENRNGDVIVSDYLRGVVVTERGGRHRFSYTGPPSGSELSPDGICTDALSHILVCDDITKTVQMIDKDGHFLSQIETQQHGIDRPQSLSYDDKTHLIWVGSYNNNRVCVYRCIERQDYLTGHCNKLIRYMYTYIHMTI